MKPSEVRGHYGIDKIATLLNEFCDTDQTLATRPVLLQDPVRIEQHIKNSIIIVHLKKLRMTECELYSEINVMTDIYELRHFKNHHNRTKIK